MGHGADVEASVRQKFVALKSGLSERMRRLWAGAEAESLGHGGVALVARATGIAISTVRAGRDELRHERHPRRRRDGAPVARPVGREPRRSAVEPKPLVKDRRVGGGRRALEVVHPKLVSILESLVEPVTRGDPESVLRWTCKSTRALADELFHGHEIRISHQKVGTLLRDLGYSLQATSKTVEGSQHPDRNAQFENIKTKSERFLGAGLPVISVDTKKKELVGNFRNAGREWRPEGAPELVDVHDFPDDAIGKAIPYGVYDVGENSGFVSVGTDHDTPVFAVTSIEAWWKRVGCKRYPEARKILITADAGGSNSYRSRVWKAELQRLADRYELSIHVSHLPPGTSKWNKIEHRLFSFITINWRGRPLRTYETVIRSIGATTTRDGLVVRASLDRRRYPTGKKVSPKEMRALKVEKDAFHGDWNYAILPRAQQQA